MDCFLKALKNYLYRKADGYKQASDILMQDMPEWTFGYAYGNLAKSIGELFKSLGDTIKDDL